MNYCLCGLQSILSFAKGPTDPCTRYQLRYQFQQCQLQFQVYNRQHQLYTPFQDAQYEYDLSSLPQKRISAYFRD